MSDVFLYSANQARSLTRSQVRSLPLFSSSRSSTGQQNSLSAALFRLFRGSFLPSFLARNEVSSRVSHASPHVHSIRNQQPPFYSRTSHACMCAESIAHTRRQSVGLPCCLLPVAISCSALRTPDSTTPMILRYGFSGL